ncbi:MAG: class I SAM-dependent methyltransferase [Defluviitaleaceae bacterium]|nr:class I SAM-dependent methyltransferase [Defluviitaleaceae bacterium]MCL2273384.1 class I SAM-dependent methyltransferase [Defluviitaleaceae bacterium]
MTHTIELAQGWRDYTLIDSGNGEKLERWGNVTVIRPDPQAIWPRSKDVDWHADMLYHRSKSGGGHWEMLRGGIPAAWEIGYDNLRFHIRPTGFKHMGLFPEQAVNWRWMQDKIRSAMNAKPSVKVLNLFAYTGGASVACLRAGAQVTHIDAAKGMNQWARDNAALSGLGNAPFRVLTDDVMKFVAREIRRGNRYDAIVMDPPVFGRGPNNEMWKLEEKLFELVTNCYRLLSDNPLFMLINAYTAGYSPAVYGNVFSAVIPPARGEITTGEVGLQAQSGPILPCGMYARVQFA